MATGIGSPHAAASRAYSTNASTSSSSATAKKIAGGASHTTATAMTTSTAPLSTRVTGRSGSLGAERHRRWLDAAVASIALLIRDHRLEQIAPAEIGPQRVGHPDLGVGDLPQQEIADAHFAAGADEQIRIGLVGGVEEFAEALLVQIVGGDVGGEHAARSVDDLGAAAVVERDVEQHPAVRRRLALADLELLAHVGRQLLGAADDPEADVVLEQRAQLEPQVALEERHQRRDFSLR